MPVKSPKTPPPVPPPSTNKPPKKKGHTPRRHFSASQKCQAVLALWTERGSASELCRSLGTTWNMLSLWQEQAMEGMMQALEPKRAAPLGNTPLNPRLQSLLERKAAKTALAATKPQPPPAMPGRPPKPHLSPPAPQPSAPEMPPSPSPKSPA